MERMKKYLSKESRRVELLVPLCVVQEGSEAAEVASLVKLHNNKWSERWDRGFRDGAPIDTAKYHLEEVAGGLMLPGNLVKRLCEPGERPGFKAVVLKTTA